MPAVSSAQQIAALHRDGYIRAGALFDARAADLLRRTMEEVS